MTPTSTASGLAAVLLSGLFAGFLTTVSVLEATLRSYGGGVYTQVRLIELQHLDDLAATLLLPAILTAAVLTVAMIRQSGSRRAALIAATAVALLVTSLLISLVISVPINIEQQGWQVSSPPGDWAAVRDRWQAAHLARTTTSVLAFVLLTAAVGPLRRSRQTPDDRQTPDHLAANSTRGDHR